MSLERFWFHKFHTASMFHISLCRAISCTFTFRNGHHLYSVFHENKTQYKDLSKFSLPLPESDWVGLNLRFPPSPFPLICIRPSFTGNPFYCDTSLQYFPVQVQFGLLRCCCRETWILRNRFRGLIWKRGFHKMFLKSFEMKIWDVLV